MVTTHPDLAAVGARRVVRVGDLAPVAKHLVDARLVPVRVFEALGSVVGQRERHAGDVPETGVLHQPVRNVDAEAVHAAVEPEPERLVELRDDVGMVPVHVRLLGREQSQVPLTRRPVRLGDPRPCRAAELALPVVRRQRPIRTASLAEVEPLPFRRAGPCRQRLLEEVVPIGGVVGHDVEDHPKAGGLGFGKQRLGLGERPEDRLDVAVVRHVVPGVLHRRRVPGVDPDGVHTEVGEVGEVGADPGDVADAVARCVGEASRVDLVDNGPSPPGRLVRRGCSRGCRHQVLPRRSRHDSGPLGGCPTLIAIATLAADFWARGFSWTLLAPRARAYRRWCCELPARGEAPVPQDPTRTTNLWGAPR